MGRPEGWMKALTGRSAMKSPGAPSFRREVEREFWREIATGVTSEEAAIGVGASQAAGRRWFRQRGGMPSIDLAPLSGRCLSFGEREEIAIARREGWAPGRSPACWGRDPATISRELPRNAATRGGKLEYRASVAQWKSELLAHCPACTVCTRAAKDQRRSAEPWRQRRPPHKSSTLAYLSLLYGWTLA